MCVWLFLRIYVYIKVSNACLCACMHASFYVRMYELMKKSLCNICQWHVKTILMCICLVVQPYVFKDLCMSVCMYACSCVGCIHVLMCRHNYVFVDLNVYLYGCVTVYMDVQSCIYAFIGMHLHAFACIHVVINYMCVFYV